MTAAAQALAHARERGGRVALIVTETPANPTNSLVDLRLMREASEWLGRERGEPRPPVTVDNTFLGRSSSGRSTTAPISSCIRSPSTSAATRF